MAFDYEHNPAILHLASAVSGLSEDQILKARDTPEGGMVVIDFAGNKRTYEFAEAMRAFRDVMNARRLSAAQAVMPFRHGGKRSTAGRKFQAGEAEAQPTSSKRRGAGRAAGAEQ